MGDAEKTKQQPLNELWRLRQRIDELEISEEARRLVEEALKEEEEFLNSAIEQTPNALWISDEAGTVIRMNQALRDLLEITDEEIIGKYNVLQDVQVKEQGFLPLVKSVFEQGKIARFTIDYFTEKEKQVELAEKTHRIIDIVISPVKNSQGQVINAICLEKDVTEQYNAEKALQESEVKYRELAESITDIFFATDEKLRYTYWNKASEELTGILAKDAIGQNIYDIFPDDESTRRSVNIYRRALATREPQHLVNERSLSGRDYVFDISAYPTVGGICVYVKDITKRTKLEEALK